jgi:hypothetical protein
MPTIDPSVKRRPWWRRALVISAQLLVGLGLGAAIAEYAFHSRDDGAFPHVNFYLPDPELGVRLEPGASMRFRLRQNPVSTIHVNSHGFRGPEWPAPAPSDILVVGDSQVFGLGVDDDATFSARLAADSGRVVLNAGVPTYGPREYLATARELLALRKVASVVVVLNFLNDPFELERPNATRHAVWDGWAVRSETAPAAVTDFPGRRWLFSRSHTVYALRRWLHERGSAAAPEGSELDTPVDLGTPSEGGLHDLVLASQRAHADALAQQTSARQALQGAEARLEQLGRKLAATDRDLVALAEDHVLARGRPGDIVTEELSESGREVRLTAAMIRKIAGARGEFIQALVRDGAAEGNARARMLLADQNLLVSERQELRARLTAGVPQIASPPSMFRAYLAEFKALCDQHGAELVVVGLPIDVQVDPHEWVKYGVTDPPDMQESLLLLADLAADAAALGMRALDGTAALRAAEPGAFLDHDIHMTARGHAALATALADTLSTPLPVARVAPRPGLPAGRSFVLAADEWGTRGEVKVAGSSAAGCTTQIQREWLRVQCSRKQKRDRFDAVQVREGATPSTMALRTDDGLSLVTPLTPGQPITARFYRKSGAQDLEIRWPAGPDGKPKFVGSFVDAPAEPAPQDPDAAAIAVLCQCHAAARDEQFCAESTDSDDYAGAACKPSCGQLWGDPRLLAACTAAHPECSTRIACIQHDPIAAPTCPEGQVHAFASNACFAVCDPHRPCADGACTPWNDGAVCVPGGA